MPRKGQFKPKVKCSEHTCINFAISKGFCRKCYLKDRAKDPVKSKIDKEGHKKFETKEYRRRSLLRRYGLDEIAYQSLYDSQNGLCAICRKVPTGNGNHSVLHIDHCHTTGKVRGLLCFDCNTGIGHLQYNLRIIDSSIKYLSQRDPRYRNVF